MLNVPKPKIVYIAHPIAGDIADNVLKVEAIVRELLRERSEYFPVAPYLEAVRHLDDRIPEDRARAFMVNHACIGSGWIDEIWCVGRMSEGVKKEILWGLDLELPIRLLNYYEVLQLGSKARPFAMWDGDYEKEFYDVLLNDGTIAYACYPNAGKMNAILDCPKDVLRIDLRRGEVNDYLPEDVIGIRLTKPSPFGDDNERKT